MDLNQLGATLHAGWTVWLVMVFLGIVGYAIWPGNREKFEHASRIPLDDDHLEG
jgi:cytochrome c oxidase cbb3-type subunit 4